MLAGREKPIVLLQKKTRNGQAYSVSKWVAPNLETLGVMLPYTPLHHLLLNQTDLLLGTEPAPPLLVMFLKPKADGGTLPYRGTVEVISSLNRDMTPVAHHLQMGVYVTYEAPSEYTQRCFNEYWLLPDETGK